MLFRSGTPSWYQVQYRTPVCSGSWTSVSPNPTANSVTISGLSANKTYDVQVAAANAGGASAYVVYGQSPAATTATSSSGYAPNTPVSLAVGTVSQSSITWTWAAGATDSTHNAATGYYVETSANGTSWSAQTDNGNSKIGRAHV